MGENSLKIKIVKDRFGYYYSLVGVINSSSWRPTKKWAIRAGTKFQSRYISKQKAYNEAEILNGVL